MSLTLQYNDSRAKGFRKKAEAALKSKEVSMPVRKAAHVWRTRLIRRTPKRWTGQTRKGWQVNEIRNNTFELTNSDKVMRWLEMGTKAHGPRHAKRLFIPLTRRAAQAGPKGVMQANAAARAHAQYQNYGSTVTGAAKKKAKYPYVYGKDFVFARRVRGIRPMWIVRNARPDAARTLRLLMREYILSAIRAA